MGRLFGFTDAETPEGYILTAHEFSANKIVTVALERSGEEDGYTLCYSTYPVSII